MIQSLIEPFDILDFLDVAGADVLDTRVEDVDGDNKGDLDQC